MFIGTLFSEYIVLFLIPQAEIGYLIYHAYLYNILKHLKQRFRHAYCSQFHFCICQFWFSGIFPFLDMSFAYYLSNYNLGLPSSCVFLLLLTEFPVQSHFLSPSRLVPSTSAYFISVMIYYYIQFCFPNMQFNSNSLLYSSMFSITSF